MPNRDGIGPNYRGLGNCNINDNKRWQGWVVAAILLGGIVVAIIMTALGF